MLHNMGTASIKATHSLRGSQKSRQVLHKRQLSLALEAPEDQPFLSRPLRRYLSTSHLLTTSHQPNTRHQSRSSNRLIATLELSTRCRTRTTQGISTTTITRCSTCRSL